MKVSNEKKIVMYQHCGLCLKEIPQDKSPQDFSALEIGWTKIGLQVWCKRHNCNVVHIDFQGRKHPANTTRKLTPAEIKRS